MPYTLTSIGNGWTLTLNGDGDTSDCTIAFSYPEDATREQECQALAALFRYLVEQELPSSKHETANVRVTVETNETE